MPLCFSSAISWALCWHRTRCPLPSREGCAKCSFPDLLGWWRGEPRLCAGRGAPRPPWAAEGSLCPAQDAAETDAQRAFCSVLQRTRAFWLSGCLFIGIYTWVSLKSQEELNAYFSGLWLLWELCIGKQSVFQGRLCSAVCSCLLSLALAQEHLGLCISGHLATDTGDDFCSPCICTLFC